MGMASGAVCGRDEDGSGRLLLGQEGAAPARRSRMTIFVSLSPSL